MFNFSIKNVQHITGEEKFDEILFLLLLPPPRKAFLSVREGDTECTIHTFVHSVAGSVRLHEANFSVVFRKDSSNFECLSRDERGGRMLSAGTRRIHSLALFQSC
jgi:hypothetical protein